MTVIGKTIESINKNTGANIEYLDIPHNDHMFINTFLKDKVMVCFNLSSGMRSLMGELSLI